MDADLTNLVNRLYVAALDAGLPQSFPVTLTYGDADDTNGRDIDVIASMTEPTGKMFANILWLNTDENSPDYLTISVRTSKTPANGMLGTWSSLSLISEIAIDQYYDDEDAVRVGSKTVLESHVMNSAPHPHYPGLTENGGSLKGKMLARTLPDGMQYDLNEFIPRRTLVNAQNDQTNGFYAILQSFNMQMGALSNQIATLTNRVNQLEQNSGSLNPSFTHVQSIASNSWVINHNLNTLNVFVEVWEAQLDFEGQTRYYAIEPDEKIIFDKNFVIVSFTSNVSGRVNILAL